MSNKNWKNRELNGLLMEKFGFDFNPLAENLENLEEGCPSSEEAEEELEEGGRASRRENESEGEERRMKHKDRVREAVRRLHDRGFSAQEIRESIGGAYKKAQKR